jgi:citrate lyase subunit beta/citryl-CoA lyase
VVFKNLKEIKKLSLDDKLKGIGGDKKPPYSKNLFRSNMMLNPLNLKHLNRIDNLDADMITLNLEDAIAPSRKKEALYNIAFFLSHLKSSNSFIVIRTNPIGEGAEEEIGFLNDFGFDAIRISKVKTKEDISKALSILSKDKELHISLETKEAFLNLKEFRIDKRFTTANLGILDLLNSLNLPQSLLQINNPTINYILSKFLIDSSFIGIRAISFMFQEYNDIQTFKDWCRQEKIMGFTSKACMGPIQAEIANSIFGITQDEIDRAKYIKDIFEINSQKEKNGFMDSRYGFIDEPIYKDALLILNSL